MKNLIEQVKQEREIWDKQKTKIKIERMLNLIEAKEREEKELIELLNKKKNIRREIINLKRDLNNGDFSRLYTSVYSGTLKSLDWIEGCAWTHNAF